MKLDLKRISLVGLGNVGYHLYHAFIERGIAVSHVLSQQDTDLHPETLRIASLAELPKEQLVLLCVPDDSIAGLVKQLSGYTLAYTSGSVHLDQLPSGNIGVFYPLQSFSKQRTLDVSTIPFFIEAENPELASSLFDLAKKLSPTVFYANSEQRKNIHLAAVWINNFTNHMVFQAQEYAQAQHIDPNVFLPLLQETLEKLNTMSAFDAQTGPARRGDRLVIQQHLSELEGIPKELYALISESILKTYSKDD